MFGRGVMTPALALAQGDAVAMLLRASARRALDEAVVVAVGVVGAGDAYVASGYGRDLWRRDVQWFGTGAARIYHVQGNQLLRQVARGERGLPSEIELSPDDYFLMVALLGATLPANHFSEVERQLASAAAQRAPALPRMALPYIERPSGRLVMRAMRAGSDRELQRPAEDATDRRPC